MKRNIKEIYQDHNEAKIAVHPHRYWSSDDVRTMCIRRNFYTCGDCEDYDMMLHYVRMLPDGPTTRNLYLIALDIWEHSDEEVKCNLEVTDIMYYLETESVHTSFWEDE